ncbi:phosphoribosylaminoimidazolesuccinocarboxamide synthase [Patescibacteria group bacterium]|nr:phosphoribosylaminoimidazolesuccinocarboxamide synthase [Patescibacteria group bacterium]
MVDISDVVVHTPEIPELPKVKDGKVRSIFNFAPGRLLMVATDRISARDIVLQPGIPGKGAILNSMSAFFFEITRDLAPNHYIPEDQLPFWQKQRLQELYEAHPWLSGRVMVVHAGWVLPIEFIFRAHITGSFYKEYQKVGGFENGGVVLGHQCPSGMKEGDRFPEIIFTPSTKAPLGKHDENLTHEEAFEHLLKETDLGVTKVRRVLNWGQMRGLSLTTWAYRYAKERGFILADHKLEVALVDGVELIVDEEFTPDSSRYFDLKQFEVGKLVNVDKEPVRQYLDEYYSGSGIPPRLTRDVVEATSQRYKLIHDALVTS